MRQDVGSEKLAAESGVKYSRWMPASRRDCEETKRLITWVCTVEGAG